jgi:hypothetical protein
MQQAIFSDQRLPNGDEIFGYGRFPTGAEVPGGVGGPSRRPFIHIREEEERKEREERKKLLERLLRKPPKPVEELSPVELDTEIAFHLKAKLQEEEDMRILLILAGS